jgi:crotonobetainyl-CoA:carnitine CoA-transferase CaiB-like acyl-CoA transferase
MIKEIAEPDIGNVKLVNVVPKLSGSPGAIRWSGRRLGQDTRDVLKVLAGYSDDAINALAESGAISCDSETHSDLRPASAPAKTSVL